MASHVTLPDGRTVDCHEAQMVTANEPWAEVVLDDGTVLRVRLVISRVMVVEGETDAYGAPLVAFDHSVVSSVSRGPEPG